MVSFQQICDHQRWKGGGQGQRWPQAGTMEPLKIVFFCGSMSPLPAWRIPLSNWIIIDALLNYPYVHQSRIASNRDKSDPVPPSVVRHVSRKVQEEQGFFPASALFTGRNERVETDGIGLEAQRCEPRIWHRTRSKRRQFELIWIIFLCPLGISTFWVCTLTSMCVSVRSKIETIIQRRSAKVS